MNVVAYTRVSTDGQIGEDKFGLEAQKQMIREYCDKNGMEIVKWYTDEGESGAKYRPGFDEMVYGVEVTNPPIEAAIVAKSDRVARDINVYYYYKASLLRKGVKLMSVSEDFGIAGPLASILEAFVVTMAEMERENIKNRTKGGRSIKAAGGGYSGGRPPYGYDVANHELVINPHRAEIVRWIFECRDKKIPLKDIVDQLNEMGEPTSADCKWSIPTLAQLVWRKKLYQGYYKYGDDQWVKGKHEPILEDDNDA